MTVNEIRQKYLEFFKSKGHRVIPSASLVPENDPTTLFTSSGMQPLIPYLLGQEHPLGKRLANSQKSFRAEDIEEVGDNRHTTFFEMLGNWSLGDYWKEEQLPWFFEFVTDVLKIDPQRLYVSVWSGAEGVPKDEDSIAIWQKLFGEKGIKDAKYAEMVTEEAASERGMQPGERIFGYQKKNWWSRSGAPDKMPVGEPGGPDSEMFYDFDPSGAMHKSEFGKYCHPNCDCGRFIEIGNSVFMEYRKKEDGSFEKLPQRNVDFGGGLERMAMVLTGTPDIFGIDVFANISRSLVKSGVISGGVDIRRLRVVLDHARAAIFLANDGVVQSNKGQGYVLRRLVRRVVMFAKLLDLNAPWFGVVLDSLTESYPELKQNKVFIETTLREEIDKFSDLIGSGAEEIQKTFSKGITAIDAFNLHQTYGFPWELTKELAKERGVYIDEDEVQEEFKKHQELSRTASAGVFKGGLADHTEKIVRLHTATHLMNAALRKVLGESVWQKGSNITEERTRFDFTHGEKMSEEQKKEVEKIVNEAIARDYEVKKEIMPLEEARKLNAIGVFGEKYPDTVSVYTVWDPKTQEVFSREFCGGPHVTHTGEIGGFRIIKEEAVAAGIRRIKAGVGDINN